MPLLPPVKRSGKYGYEVVVPARRAKADPRLALLLDQEFFVSQVEAALRGLPYHPKDGGPSSRLQGERGSPIRFSGPLLTGVTLTSKVQSAHVDPANLRVSLLALGPAETLDGKQAADLGVCVRQLSPGLSALEVPRPSLEEVLSLPGFTTFELASPMYRSTGATAGASGGPSPGTEAWRSSCPGTADGSEKGTGEGTCLLVIDDTGLDWTHPELRDDNGGTRILALWDQDHLGGVGEAGHAVPAAEGGGWVWTRAELDAALADPSAPAVRHRFDDGHHGTLVTVAAAGNASRGSAVAGPARRADLVFVRTRRSGALPLVGEPGEAQTDSVSVARALSWGFEQAGVRPTVALIALNDSLGAHDGSSLLERYIDQSARLGRRLVVVSAGNQPQDGRIGFQLLVLEGGAASTETTWFSDGVPAEGGGFLHATGAQIWFDAEVSAKLRVRSGGAKSWVVAPEDRSLVVKVDDDLTLTVTPAMGLHNRDWCYSLTLTGTHKDLYAFNLFLSLEVDQGSPGGVFRWWTDRRGAFGTGQVTTTVSPPGTARSALVVGAANGATALATASSNGPTADARQQPEVCAQHRFSVHVPSHGDHPVALTDTSGAAAGVAGLACVAFQHLPAQATGEAVRECLIAAATSAGRAPQADWGWGWLNPGRLAIRLKPPPVPVLQVTKMIVEDEDVAGMMPVTVTVENTGGHARNVRVGFAWAQVGGPNSLSWRTDSMFARRSLPGGGGLESASSECIPWLGKDASETREVHWRPPAGSGEVVLAAWAVRPGEPDPGLPAAVSDDAQFPGNLRLIRHPGG